MKIILLENIRRVGSIGEIIEVKSREDVKTYLKSKDIDLSELNFYGKNHHIMVILGTEKCGFIMHQENQWATRIKLLK